MAEALAELAAVATEEPPVVASAAAHAAPATAVGGKLEVVRARWNYKTAESVAAVAAYVASSRFKFEALPALHAKIGREYPAEVRRQAKKGEWPCEKRHPTAEESIAERTTRCSPAGVWDKAKSLLADVNNAVTPCLMAHVKEESGKLVPRSGVMPRDVVVATKVDYWGTTRTSKHKEKNPDATMPASWTNDAWEVFLRFGWPAGDGCIAELQPLACALSESADSTVVPNVVGRVEQRRRQHAAAALESTGKSVEDVICLDNSASAEADTTQQSPSVAVLAAVRQVNDSLAIANEQNRLRTLLQYANDTPERKRYKSELIKLGQRTANYTAAPEAAPPVEPQAPPIPSPTCGNDGT